MDLIAHRGFAASGPENALPTLRRAGAVADAVEFDVRLAGDGEPVVFHDRDVDRLTPASGSVADYTAAELAALPIAGGEATIPTLAAVLEALAGPLVVDIKTDRVTDRLASLLAGYDDPVLVSSFRPAVLAAVPEDLAVAVLWVPAEFAADLPAAALTDADEALALADDLGAAALHPHHFQCTPALVATAHEDDRRVNAWTVRSRAVARDLRRVGVDGAIADSPDYLDE